MTVIVLSRLRRVVPLTATALCLMSFAAFWAAQHLARVTHLDLLVYREEGRAVLEGADLYALRATDVGLPATYPPFAALLFTPLPLLDTTVMHVLSTAVNLLLLVLFVRLALRLIAHRCEGRMSARVRELPVTLGVAALAVWCEPVWTTVRYGQINLLIAVLVLWDMQHLPGTGLRARGRRWAGAGIGLATAIKLTPGLFVVFLLLTGLVAAARHGTGRDWLRHARGAVVAFLGATGLAAVLLPRDSWQFWTDTVMAANRVGFSENTANQSLRGVLARLLHTPDPGAWWVVAAALTGAAGLWIAVRAALRGAPAWAALACAATALLVSPVSWSHHWVWCVPMVLLAGVEALRRGGALRWGVAVLSGLVFCAYALWWVPHGPERPELRQGGVEFALSGLYVLVALAFLVLAWAATGRGPGAGTVRSGSLRTVRPQPRTVGPRAGSRTAASQAVANE